MSISYLVDSILHFVASKPNNYFSESRCADDGRNSYRSDSSGALGVVRDAPPLRGFAPYIISDSSYVGVKSPHALDDQCAVIAMTTQSSKWRAV